MQCTQLNCHEADLFHNSVDFIGYPRQAYRGFLSLPKDVKMLQVLLTCEVVTGYQYSESFSVA